MNLQFVSVASRIRGCATGGAIVGERGERQRDRGTTGDVGFVSESVGTYCVFKSEDEQAEVVVVEVEVVTGMGYCSPNVRY